MGVLLNMEENLQNTEEQHFTENSSLKCFVMMPFGKKDEYDKQEAESNYIYKHIICKAIEEIEKKIKKSIEIIRETDKKSAGNINKSILKNIASADICIVDITGLNPNVFFELGIRYCLRTKTTILIKQIQTEIPFDIQGYKCTTYNCLEPDLAIKSIFESLFSSLSNRGSVDSLVYETFPEMKVDIPNVLHSSVLPSNSNNVMSWGEWWERIEQMADLLRDAFDNGRFVPTAVLGISNGGLLVADSLGRKVFKTVPILSFYADRWKRTIPDANTSAYYYFDNPFNKAMLQQIKVFAKQGKITLLLIDDIVFSSSTIFQAIAFLKQELGTDIDILFTPMYCREPDRLKAISEILPMGFRQGSVIGITEDEYFRRLSTSRSYLPYDKAIGKD